MSKEFIVVINLRKVLPICPESREIRLSGGFIAKLFFDERFRQQQLRNKLFANIFSSLTKILKQRFKFFS